MEIIKAETKEFNAVKEITQNTISVIYPHYYPKGAVDFFLKHHSDDKIMQDILQGNVYILSVGEMTIGTPTINGNEINRLFVFFAAI